MQDLRSFASHGFKNSGTILFLGPSLLHELNALQPHPDIPNPTTDTRHPSPHTPKPETARCLLEFAFVFNFQSASTPSYDASGVAPETLISGVS